MNPTTRDPQAPESYATFWDPLGPNAPLAQPAPAPAEALTAAAPDARPGCTEPTGADPARQQREPV